MERATRLIIAQDRIIPGRIKWDWKKKAVLGLGIAVFILQAVRMSVDGKGDFNLHWESGRRLVQGDDLYYFGVNCPYPPFWALAHAPFSFLPIPVAQLLCYPVFVLAFVLLVRALGRLTQDKLSIGPNTRFWVLVGAVLFASRFLVRDMMECGVNLLMVAVAWFAVELWTRHKEKQAGLWLGLAISLKCTPALFLLFFAWKRQWKTVGWTAVFVVGFTLSPIFMLGPQKYASAMTYWTTMSWRGFAKSDPSLGTLGQEPIQNDALRPSMARFFMQLPEDHKARLDHPLYLDFLNLDPTVAGWVIRILIFGLLISIARRIPRNVEDRQSWNVLWECSMVSVLLLLLSPITWGQHCVGVLPAFYLLLLTRQSGLCGNSSSCRPIASPQAMLGKPAVALGHSRWVIGYLGFYTVAILLLNRTVIGKTGSLLVDSYHLVTWCLLLLVFTILYCRDRQLLWREVPELSTGFGMTVRRKDSASQAEETPQAAQADDAADPVGEHIEKIA